VLRAWTIRLQTPPWNCARKKGIFEAYRYKSKN
jgi:hypothetical protein